MFFLSLRECSPPVNTYFAPGVCLILFLLFAPYAVLGQSGGGVDSTGTDGKHTIQGRLYFPSGRTADTGVKIKLETVGTGSLSVFADINGSFSFRNLAPGSYTIVVEGNDDYETVRESLYIDQETPGTTRNFGGAVPRVFNIPIYLQPRRGRHPDNSTAKLGVLDASLVNIPKPAQDFYQKGMQAVRDGERRKAIDQFNSAISLYPKFALALNELGVQYLMIGQPDKAAESLRAAVALNEMAFSPRLNYGIALLNKNDFSGAETQLREALKINDTSAVAHMYLGITLIKLHKYDDAETQLQRAASNGKSEVSMAHKYLGGLYWSKKEYKRAADELEKYLELSPKAADAERVRSTVKELRSKS